MSNKLTDLENEAEESSNKYFVKLELEDKKYQEFTGMKTGVMPRQNRERLAQAEGYKDCYMEIKQQVIKGKIEVMEDVFDHSFDPYVKHKLDELKQLETQKI